MWVPGTLPGKLQLYLPPRCCCWVGASYGPSASLSYLQSRIFSFSPQVSHPTGDSPTTPPCPMPFCCCSRLVPATLFLTGWSSQADQRPSK